jgi:hypothetical protein
VSRLIITSWLDSDEPYELRRFESKHKHRTGATLFGRSASEYARRGAEFPGLLPELSLPFLSHF